MKKIAKMIGLTILGIIALIVIVVFLFVNISPEFGGKISKAQKAEYSKSENYKDGKFLNLGNVKMDMGFDNFMKMLRQYMKSQPNTSPKTNVEVSKIDSADIAQYNDESRMFWFGHSTFLLEIENKNILIDPMLGEVPAPHPMLGGKRFSKELPIGIEELPKIDAVILSHDHYDHLDFGSIMKLKDKVDMFYAPLGVGAHLREWGVDSTKIVELDWWQDVNHNGLIFRCTPAQHFSGRGLSDRGNTLWASWIIKSEKENIFFSGDSGYGYHFKEIGEKYGPFDFAMMECGQYNKLWSEIHMFPEETVQATIDVKAKKMMPIHWGAFKLALHEWTDPVERVTKKAKELRVEVLVPTIGDPILIHDSIASSSNWWKEN